MCHIQVFSAADLDSEAWTGRILALDRENMAQILQESGREFPEQRRRETLRNPSLVLLALICERELAGYIDFCDDWREQKDIYLSSIQLSPQYRHGMAVAKLIVAATRILKMKSFERLRGDVQQNNTAAIGLFTRLGFVLQERGDNPGSWEIFGDKSLLDSEYASKLMKRVEGDFGHGRQSERP